MNRYLVKFEKTGLLRYISHLDLLRLFLRTLKRSGIGLVYTKGFNPHPKMSLAQPLPLGYTSSGEYLEFETPISYDESFIISSLNCKLPCGIKALDCRRVSEKFKNAASLVCWASYEVIFSESAVVPSGAQLLGFLDQSEIYIAKRNKKKTGSEQIDIKSLIGHLSLLKNEEDPPIIYMKVRTGSAANLNPKVLMDSLLSFCNISYEEFSFHLKRLELYQEDGQSLYKDL